MLWIVEDSFGDVAKTLALPDSEMARVAWAGAQCKENNLSKKQRT